MTVQTPVAQTGPDDTLLTAPDQALGPHLSDGAKHLVALFKSGALYMVKTPEENLEVSSVIALAKRQGIDVHSPVYVDKGVITGFYYGGRSPKPLQTRPTAPHPANGDSRKDDAYQMIDNAHRLGGVSDLIIRCEPQTAGVYAIMDGAQRRFVENDWSPEYADRFQKSIYTWAGQEGAAEKVWKQGQHQVGSIVKGLPPGVDSIRIQILAAAFGIREMILRLMPTPKGGRNTLQNLKFREKDIKRLTKLMYRSGGLVLVTGPTGSGKSHTTDGLMSASLELFPTHRWLTIEDPPEFKRNHPNVTPLDVVRTAIDDDTDQAMADTMEAALRSIPRRFLVGEIRSSRVAKLTLGCVIAGHGTISTTHCDDAPTGIDRLLDLGVNPKDIKNPKHMRGIVAQRLVRHLCDCKVQVTRNDWKGPCPDWLEKAFEDRHHLSVPNPEPCPHCREGYKPGRVPIVEVMQTDRRILEMLLAGDMPDAVDYWKESLDGETMVDQAMDMLAAGQIDPTELTSCLDL